MALAAVCVAAGCSLPMYRGPGSRSIMTSRQLSQRGADALDRQNWTEAESLFSQAVAACPADVEARKQYAEALWRRGAHNEAIAQLEAAREQAATDTALLVRLADFRLQIGQTDAALADAEAAIDSDPRSPDAWLLRGRVHHQRGDARQSLADLHRALSYDGRHPQVLHELAVAYFAAGDPQRALANLQGLLDQHPPGDEPQQLLYEVGLAYAGAGRYGEAVDSFQTALARAAPRPEILVQLGEAQAQRGYLAEARAAWEQARLLDPTNPRYNQLLARLPAPPGVATQMR